MATTHQDTNVNQLVINKMTKQEYDNLPQVSETELYLVEEQVDSVVTENSTNPVQSGAVYEALQQSSSNINDGTTTFTKNNETIGTTSANQSENKTISLPNDVIMCKMSDGLVYDSYITYTKVKQYLPDYPYYSDNLNWEIGGNPPMRASITEGDYYLDIDTNHIFVADENSEMQDVTSTVVIQGDSNKLYCDVTTNMLYRYDGTNFVALTSNFSGDYNDLINKPDLNFLKQRDLTTYQGENDEIVQHIGSNSSGYVNGYVYKKSNVYSITYNGVTYTRVGKTDDDITWKLYKITQDNINYILPQEVSIGDNFWVVDNFITLRVVHIFEIDNIGENAERTQMDVEGHFLGTNITLHFVAPYSEIINTSKALIYKNGNNYLYCDLSFRLFASSVNNNNANVIPFNGTINNDYIWQRINVQPNQLSVESSKVKYTLSDGTTKLTLAQEGDVKDIPISFTPDSSPVRANIQSGASVANNLGIISRWFSDFNKYDCVFFTFSYSSLIVGLKDLIIKGFPFGVIFVSDSTSGIPATGSFIIYYYINTIATNAINLIAKMNGDNFNLYIGNVWRNQSAEPTWKILLAQNL